LSHFFLTIYSVARLINRPFARAATAIPKLFDARMFASQLETDSEVTLVDRLWCSLRRVKIN